VVLWCGDVWLIEVLSAIAPFPARSFFFPMLGTIAIGVELTSFCQVSDSVVKKVSVLHLSSFIRFCQVSRFCRQVSDSVVKFQFRFCQVSFGFVKFW
jgi:hypothetical protein